MSDKFHGGILAGATSVTIPVVIRKTSDNTERTALSAAAATLTASYWRQGASRVAVTLSNLASIAAAWAKGGFKQVHLSNMPGLYRLDIPNSACATGADFFAVGVKHSGSYVFFERYALESKNAPLVYSAMAKSASIQGQVNAALSAMHLDHLMLASAPAAVPVANTLMDRIMASVAGGVFNRTLHSLKAIRDKLNSTAISGGASIASVQTVVKLELSNLGLDHLVQVSAPAGMPRSNSILEKIMVSAAAGTFTRSLHSLRAIREKVNTVSAGGGATAGSVTTIVKLELSALGLDHLVAASAPAGIPANNTVLEKFMVSAGGGLFDRTLHSLKAIKNQALQHATSTALSGKVAGLNNVSQAQVLAQVRVALSGMHLDHLLLTSAPAGVPASNTALEKIMVSAAAATFDRTAQSLKAIRNRESILATSAAVGTQVLAQTRAALSGMHLDHLLLASSPAGVPVSNTVVQRILNSAAGGTFTPSLHSLRAIREKLNLVTAGASIASVQTVVKIELSAIGLDHLVQASAPANMPRSNTVLDQVMRSAAAATFTRSLHSLKGIKNKIDSLPGSSTAVTAADRSAIATQVWNRSRALHVASGTFGKGVGTIVGKGNYAVNHNTGGTDTLRLVDSSGAGIGEAQIRVYKKSDYTSGLITPPYIQGQSETKDDGRWANPVYLDSGITYTVVYNKAGVIETTTAEVAL